MINKESKYDNDSVNADFLVRGLNVKEIIADFPDLKAEIESVQNNLIEQLEKYYSKDEVKIIIYVYPKLWCEALISLLTIATKSIIYPHEKRNACTKDYLDYLESEDCKHKMGIVDNILKMITANASEKNKKFLEEKLRSVIEGFYAQVNFNPKYADEGRLQYYSTFLGRGSYRDESEFIPADNEVNFTDEEMKAISFVLLINVPLKIYRKINKSHTDTGKDLHKRSYCLPVSTTDSIIWGTDMCTQIILCRGGFSDKGFNYLCLAMKINKKVNVLALKYNKIGVKRSKMLKKVLEVNKTLEILDLEENDIDNESIKHITDGISKESGLSKLKLAHNSFDYDGAEYLSRVLKTSIVKIVTFPHSIYHPPKNNLNNKGLKFVNRNDNDIDINLKIMYGKIYTVMLGKDNWEN